MTGLSFAAIFLLYAPDIAVACSSQLVKCALLYFVLDRYTPTTRMICAILSVIAFEGAHPFFGVPRPLSLAAALFCAILTRRRWPYSDISSF